MKVGNYTIDKSQLLIKAISGSRAYGLSTPQSDTDIKGVFIQSKKEYFGIEHFEVRKRAFFASFQKRLCGADLIMHAN